MPITHYYQQALTEKQYRADEAQAKAIARLQALHDEWAPEPGFLARYFGKKSPSIKGVYLWGGVGRGKSFLMDAFFHSMPEPKKTRVHFHEFMRGVHQRLHAICQQANPLETVARQVASQYRLICFDEFHVSDIADAMILYRLLQGLLANGVTFVMTSNYAPDDLYPDGLHRDRLLPAIALIHQHLDVLNVDTGVDYRRRTLTPHQCYFTPLGEDSNAALLRIFQQLSDQMQAQPSTIVLEGRTLQLQARAAGVLWCSFAQLCEMPRAQQDYLALAAQYHTIIVSDIPKLLPKDASAARRFTWLIDVLYDHRVKMVFSAQTPPEQLYTEGILANEFHRTVSRMVEMQSKEYLDAPIRHAVTL